MFVGFGLVWVVCLSVALHQIEKENGLGTQIVLGRGAVEPIVLGNVLKDLLDTHFNDIKTHLDNLKTHLSLMLLT